MSLLSSATTVLGWTLHEESVDFLFPIFWLLSINLLSDSFMQVPAQLLTTSNSMFRFFRTMVELKAVVTDSCLFFNAPLPYDTLASWEIVFWFCDSSPHPWLMLVLDKYRIVFVTASGSWLELDRKWGAAASLWVYKLMGSISYSNSETQPEYCCGASHCRINASELYESLALFHFPLPWTRCHASRLYTSSASG